MLLLTWLLSVTQLRDAGRNSELVVRSMLDAGGIRHIVRGAAAAAADAPLGNAIFLLMGYGICSGSGVMNFKGQRSLKERRALLYSAICLVLMLMACGYGLYGGSRVLLDVTGRIQSDGIVFLLFLLVSLPSAVYGLVSYRLRSPAEILGAMIGPLTDYASFFVCLLLASQILDVFTWSGLDRLCCLGPEALMALRLILYWLPLPWLVSGNGPVDKIDREREQMSDNSDYICK